MSASGDGGGGSGYGSNDAPAKLPGEAEVLNHFPELKAAKRNSTTGIKGLSWSRKDPRHRFQFHLNGWDGGKLKGGSGMAIGCNRREAFLAAAKNLLSEQDAERVRATLGECMLSDWARWTQAEGGLPA